jgi:acetyltransferase-like isoleucine patch superfamily enzyme
MSDSVPVRSGYDKMLAGEIYEMPDWDLLGRQVEAGRKLAEFNMIPNWEIERRQAAARELLGALGNSVILSPVFWEYGKHIEIGDNCFFNAECLFLDGAPIRIGSRNAFGPRVQLLTAGHPIEPEVRSRHDAAGAWIGANNINAPITIGSDCWIGAGTIICPGVEIGDGTTVGAGSVVTASLPTRVFAAGNPCRVIKEIGSA